VEFRAEVPNSTQLNVSTEPSLYTTVKSKKAVVDFILYKGNGHIYLNNRKIACFLTIEDSIVSKVPPYMLDSLQIEFQWGARVAAPVWTGPGTHLTSCTMGTESLSRE
jgi:hypothetical protein